MFLNLKTNENLSQNIYPETDFFLINNIYLFTEIILKVKYFFFFNIINLIKWKRKCLFSLKNINFSHIIIK